VHAGRTLYIERGKRSEARRARQIIAAELRRGTGCGLSRGVTTFGRSLERFHSALFQPALDAAATLQPGRCAISIAAGTPTPAGYVGDTSLFESVWPSSRRVTWSAEFNLLARFPARAQTRPLACRKRAEAAIARALGARPAGDVNVR